jgi:outer membrane protein assembly factor BamB
VVDSRIFVPLVDEHQVVTMNGLDGQQQWEYTTGGRIDSPPVYYRGTLLFGSADGWVYCVRAGDGRLVWRFHAAPEQRLIGAFGQLESAWPVHGSISVLNGIAYFAAGRSSHLDGGIYLFAVDAVSGKLRYQKRLQGPSYDINNISQNYKLPMGALPDILQCDGELIYMRNLVFNAKLQRQMPPRRQTSDRIHAKGGLLDDSYFKRIPWSFGPKSSYARLVVHDQTAAYFIRMFDSLRGLDPSVYFTPGKEGYLLFATDKETGKQIWKKRIPVRVNAMVATDKLLFVAGLPDVVDPNDPLAAFEARKGGMLSACDKTDGKTLWEYKLSSPPVFNGLVAANGCLYVAMKNGMMVAFGRL